MSVGHFIFDQNKCVGCQACVVACMNENGFQEPNQWRELFTQNKSKLPGIPLFHISLACNHCEEAPCMKNCPALAYHRSEISGAVLHNEHACIGCQYCTWQCPYEAPKYNPGKGIVEKCNFCESRQAVGKAPACTLACPTGALDFSMERTTQTATKEHHYPYPSISIMELENRKAPEMDMELFSKEDTIKAKRKEKNISALQEWPLVVFTFIISAMVAFTVSGVNHDSDPKLKWAMVVAGGLALLLSSFHLGRKERIWRLVLNLKNSWLSREVFLVGLYFALFITDFFFFKLNHLVVLIPGLASLIAIDSLYRPLQHHWKTQLQSGQSLLISFSILFLLLHSYWILLFLLLGRLFIQLQGFYTLDEKLFKNKLFVIRWAVIDVSIILLIFHVPFPIIFVLFLIGEFLDRILFYNELMFQRVIDQN